jgi:hypothetical protein
MLPSPSRLRARPSDSADPVKIDANYLSDPQDLEDLVAGLTFACEMGHVPALRAFTERQFTPDSFDVAELTRFLRDGLTTFCHQCGTAKMGRDAMAVVDGKLKVYGVDEKLMRRFKSARHLQRFASIHDQVGNLFMRCRYHWNAQQKRALRTQAFETWESLMHTAMLEHLTV